MEPVANQNSLGFYNWLFLVLKPNNQWRPVLDLSTLNTFLNTESFKLETPETIRTSLQSGEWVTSIDFKDAYFHIPIHSQYRKYMRFHIQGQSYQFKALPFGLSTAPMEFTVVAKEVKLMALQRGIRIHQYLDDWLVSATSHQTCLQHTQTLVALCRELGWLMNKEKSELESKEVFNFVGYQFDLREGKVRPTPDRWQTLQDKILSILSSSVCPVWQFMSLIGLLTATEKQVHLGRLHMIPIQWHLEEQLEGTGITRKVYTRSQVAPPPPKVVAGGKQCASRSTITLSKTCSADIYRLIKRRAGTKSSLSGPKRVPRPVFKQYSPGSHRQHNSGCLYQQRGGGGMKSGSLCALLWRILSWCTRKQVTLKAHHIPGQLNVIADKLSRLDQTIQTEWSLHPEVFQAIYARWHQPQVDLFATRFNKVVEKLQDYPCNRIILIAPGWPNMPWFWDLVAMSSQISLCLPNLPNLVSQPFNQTLHRNLSNWNLHAWLIEPQQSRSRDSLRQWQHKLRLLKEDQPDLSMRQSGPFLQSGASVIKWTSGHHL